jgi:hypothetical protein
MHRIDLAADTRAIRQAFPEVPSTALEMCL